MRIFLAGVLSASYLFAYLSLGIVALVLGAVATQRGLGLAVDLGAALITLLSLATIILLATLWSAVSGDDVNPRPRRAITDLRHGSKSA